MASDQLWTLLWQAALVGLSIAAPVGPIGLLTIQPSLNQGAAAGLATGLGAALADAAYGGVAAFSVAGVMAALSAARLPLALLGSGFLLWLAWRTWQAPLAQAATAPSAQTHLLRCLAGTFVLTLSNPATILSFAAVFGALAGSWGQASAATAWWLVSGVFAGSALWWLLLSQVTSRMGSRFDLTWRGRVNRISAMLLAGFALWQLGALLH